VGEGKYLLSGEEVLAGKDSTYAEISYISIHSDI
jgi:hypothetical protein